MCGIAGVSCCKAAKIETARIAVERMVSAMHHRGPDDQGTEVVGSGPHNVVIGNTRLAILDLSRAGHQPMHDPETGNWCVLNGEIYNHLEIRQALGNVRWRSTSDTETLLRAYAAWGFACVERMRGMFAIALYDAARQTLWCVRDRLGIKPFYYAAAPDLFAFASEVKVLLSSGIAPHELDRDGLAAYMRFGSVIEPVTLVRGIRSLSPGHWIEVANSVITRQHQYWSLAECAADSNTENREDTREMLQASVREHMISDVPVGCFLSGGLDSSAITACAASASSAPLRTFTVAFHGTEMDESSEARAVATHFGTEHTEVRLPNSEVVAQIPLAVASMDLPSIDGVNTFIVSRAVRSSGIKVVLSGLGGDEVFGGYRSFRLLPFAENWADWVGRLPRQFGKLVPGGERGFELMRPGISLGERYAVLRALWPQTELRRMGLPAPQEMIEEPDPALPATTRVSLLELSVYLRSVLLRDSDVMSMAHSIELRVPFLDHRLVEHALRNHLACNGRKDKLRAAFSDVLPARTLRRAKQGFELPMGAWLQGILKGFCEEGLEVLDREEVLSVPTSEFMSRFRAGNLSWPRLWQLVVLGHWFNRFKKYQFGAGSMIERNEDQPSSLDGSVNRVSDSRPAD
jgi:asparagine synthase (glutamine-hydrolysing)